ncbi:MAG: hypothetical protein ACJAVV_000109 [Alphaproteobacteria bacterium]|jgi:hypothetical protein
MGGKQAIKTDMIRKHVFKPISAVKMSPKNLNQLALIIRYFMYVVSNFYILFRFLLPSFKI